MREMIRENNEFLIIYEFVDGVRNYWVIFLPNIRIIKKMSQKFKSLINIYFVNSA